MKITVAQLNYHIGNFTGNLQKMLEAVESAKAQGADIVCFAELAIERHDMWHRCMAIHRLH